MTGQKRFGLTCYSLFFVITVRGEETAGGYCCRTIQAAIWVREVSPSLVKMWSRWLSAVRWEITSLAAISIKCGASFARAFRP